MQADDDWQLLLRNYAIRAEPQKIPPTIRLEHTDTSITVYDAYPKSIFHFLILPRPIPGFLDVDEVDNLRTLFKCGKEKAKKVLDGLAEVAKKLKEEMEQEMVHHHGFKWDVWVGFHPVPSMKHLHLHVMSGDLCSDAVKHKRHYNSFHPKRGFFLHLDDVMSWFDAMPSFYAERIQLKPSTYEPLLKHDLECFHCDEEFKTMPKLKEHLQKEWDELAKRERPYWQRKREAKKRALKVAETAKQKSEPVDRASTEDKGEGTSRKRPSSPAAAPDRKRTRTTESPPHDELAETGA